MDTMVFELCRSAELSLEASSLLEMHNNLRGAPLFVKESSIFKLMLSLCLINKNLDQVLNDASDNWFPAATLEQVRTAVHRFAEAWPPGHHRGATKRLHELTVMLNIVDFQPRSA